MKTRYTLTVILCSVIMLFGFSGVAQAYTVADFNWWHSTLNQIQRENLLIKAANQDLGKSVSGGFKLAGNCKEWVRSVVKRASKGVMTIPPTHTTDLWRWQTAKYIWADSPYNVGLLEYARPGQIVQMLVHNNNGATIEHTAIIYKQDAGKKGLWLIDANWGAKTIKTHYVTFSDFYGSLTKRKFTLYSIL